MVHYELNTLLQNTTDIIIKCDGYFISKCDKIYYKMRQVVYYKIKQFYCSLRTLFIVHRGVKAKFSSDLKFHS